MTLYGRGAYAPKAYQSEIAGQVRELAKRYGVGAASPAEGRRIGPPGLRPEPLEPPEPVPAVPRAAAAGLL